MICVTEITLYMYITICFLSVDILLIFGIFFLRINKNKNVKKNKNYKSYHHRNFDYGNKRKCDTLHNNAIYLSVLL